MLSFNIFFSEEQEQFSSSVEEHKSAYTSSDEQTSIKDVWSTEYEELLLRLLLLMMMWLGEELIVVWGVK